MARDKETRPSCRLRGKVQNTWEIDRDRLFANNEIHDIAVALGVDSHTADSRSTSPGCATARSSSCPTPTSTAPIQTCC